MKKIKRTTALWLFGAFTLLMICLTTYIIVKPFSSDTITTYGYDSTPIHFTLNVFMVLLCIIFIMILIRESINYEFDNNKSIFKRISYLNNNDDNYSNDDNIETFKLFKFNKLFKFKWWKLITLVLLIIIIVNGVKIFNHTASLYNTSKSYHHKYNQVTKARLGYYDNMWKTYDIKDGIATINKDVFVQVTKIIMENRGDGKNITWKWLQENQQIDYSEFTKFYEDLTTYVESKREGYYALELQCQQIAMSNNVLLDTFPNNFYNKIINCEKIEYNYGFLSDSTNIVFSNKVENLK